MSYDDIQAISRELGNTANEQVRPTIYIETEVVKADSKHFLVCAIANGKNYQRNPFMAVFATNALRYRGIGSGIVRILEENKNITFENDDNGKEFKAIIWRGITDNKDLSGKITDNKNLSGNVPDKLSIRQTIIDKLSINDGIVDKISVSDSTIDKMVDILWYVTLNQHCSTEAIAEACSLSVENAKKYMQRLTKIDLVIPEGGNRNRTYSCK